MGLKVSLRIKRDFLISGSHKAEFDCIHKLYTISGDFSNKLSIHF